MADNPELPKFAPTSTEVAFSSRQTYKLRLPYGILKTAMHTSVWRLDSTADINFIGSKMVSHERENCIKRNDLHSLRTAARQLFTFDALVLSHLRLDNIQTRVWLGIVAQLAFNMLLETSFIDHLIRKSSLRSGRSCSGIRTQRRYYSNDGLPPC